MLVSSLSNHNLSWLTQLIRASAIKSGDSRICPIFQIEAGKTLGLSLFRLSRLNRMVVLDSLSVSETKCWLSCRKPVVIKGPSSPIHDHLRVEELVGNQEGRKANEAPEGWLEKGL